MTKLEYMNKHGIKLREVTKEDREQAKTDYQRDSSFVITYPNGKEYYSKRGSLKDIKLCEIFAYDEKNILD